MKEPAHIIISEEEAVTESVAPVGRIGDKISGDCLLFLDTSELTVKEAEELCEELAYRIIVNMPKFEQETATGNKIIPPLLEKYYDWLTSPQNARAKERAMLRLFNELVGEEQ